MAEITTSKAGSMIWHLTDHLQSSSVDTDENGEMVQVLDYFPYGDERVDQHAEDYENDYRFTGKERDKASGLLYYESRYYDSGMGRFMSIDPWAGDIGNPQSLNKYAYTVNNPLKYVDPTGDIPLLIVAGVIGAGLLTIDGVGENAAAPTSAAQLVQNMGIEAINPASKIKAAKNALSAGGDIVKQVRNKTENFTDKFQKSREQMKNLDFRDIAGGKAKANFRDAPDKAKAYGGDVQDYVKQSSHKSRLRDGSSMETHSVLNKKTGKRYEEKVKIQKKKKKKKSKSSTSK